MKFLHFADCHLDAPFVELGQMENKANIRRNELKQTFSKVIQIGKSNGVDVILISGDIFEHEYVSKDTIDYINNEFSKIPQIKVFIAPGNHDPFLHNSYYNTYKWSDNVYIFNNFEKVYLQDINTNIYGIGLNDFNVDKCMIDYFEVEKDKINILVTHGSLDIIGGTDKYHPIKASYLESLELDYCALGHIHKPNINEESGICYSGSLEPLGFDELGEHGIILGEITKSYKTINFHSVSKRKYYIKEVDVTDLKSTQDILEEIKYTFNINSYKENFVKIILIGNIEANLFDINIIEQELKERFYFIKIEDKTNAPYALENIENQNDIKGMFVKRMKELIEKASDKDKEMLNKALQYGIDALVKGEVKL